MHHILCLHGYRQNAEVFAHKIESLVKALRRHGHVVSFLDAPLTLEDGLRGWFPLDRKDISQSCEYSGFEEACRVIRDVIARDGITALLGFSQGAVLASYLVHEGAVHRAILFSPFLIRDAAHSFRMTGTTAKGEALIFAGLRDDLVPAADSLKVLQGAAVYVTHPAGHVVPSNSTAKTQVLQFLCDDHMPLPV